MVALTAEGVALDIQVEGTLQGRCFGCRLHYIEPSHGGNDGGDVVVAHVVRGGGQDAQQVKGVQVVVVQQLGAL